MEKTVLGGTGKTIMTYDLYGHAVDMLTKLIHPYKDSLKLIYAIPRGGLPIAVHLAHHLGIEMTTDKEYVERFTCRNDELLVVDDLTDTGMTLKGLFYEWYDDQSHIKTATLIFKPRKDIRVLFKPDFYVFETLDWVKFPWENPDEKPNREGYE